MRDEDEQALDRYKQGHSIRTIAEDAHRSFGFIYGLVKESDDPMVQKRHARTLRDLWGSAGPYPGGTERGSEEPAAPTRPSGSRSRNLQDRAAFEEVPVEVANKDRYVTERPDEPKIALRREAGLVQRYVAWLSRRGEVTVRHRISIPGGGSLYTDLYNTTTRELLEAKSSSDRMTIRTGLGQILDYSRYIPHGCKALLLPIKPSADLVKLLQTYDVQAVWETASTFKRSAKPGSR